MLPPSLSPTALEQGSEGTGAPVLAAAPYKPAGGTHLWQSTSQQDTLSYGHMHGLQAPAPQYTVLHAEITSNLLTAQQGASSCSTS